MRLRRFAAVVHKPLNLCVRCFVAAVLRWFAAVPKKAMKTTCGGAAVVAVRHPPYPLCAPRRLLARAAGAGTRQAGRPWPATSAHGDQHSSERNEFRRNADRSAGRLAAQVEQANRRLARELAP
jgi:hypothetical protein